MVPLSSLTASLMILQGALSGDRKGPLRLLDTSSYSVRLGSLLTMVPINPLI